MAQLNDTEKKKTGIQHVILMIALLVGLYIWIFYQIIPSGAAGFVVPLFMPSGERLQKVGFVKFKGLVWATTTKEKEPFLQGKNKEISKADINRDYIFDFTFNKRTMKDNGYVKSSTEFYVKSDILGDFPIILEPWTGFWILAFDIALVLAVLITILLPSSIGLFARLIEIQIDNNRVKIRLQTGFTNEIVDLLIMPDNKFVEVDPEKIKSVFKFIWNRTVTEETSSTKHSLRFEDVFDDNMDLVVFRNNNIYVRIKEYYSEFIAKEIIDTKDGLIWSKNHLLVGKGLRLYMAHHFTERYSNNVTGLAYGGAAFLIVAVGIRGLKFIPAQKPSLLMMAIFLEFSMLMMLAVTLFYTEEEERMDTMLKKMEDANRSELEVLRGQQHDIHQLTNALVGQTAEIIKNRVENAITEYMTNNDNVDKAIATEISSKIMKGLREAYTEEK